MPVALKVVEYDLRTRMMGAVQSGCSSTVVSVSLIDEVLAYTIHATR
jgi:hypothetical protein